jgi:hypothetical protein
MSQSPRRNHSKTTTTLLVRRLGLARDEELGPRATRSARATTAHRRSAEAGAGIGTGTGVGLPGRASSTRRLAARTSDFVSVCWRRRAMGEGGAEAWTGDELTMTLSRRLQPLLLIVLLRDHSGSLLQSNAPSFHSRLWMIARRREPIAKLVRRRGLVSERVVVDTRQGERLAPSSVVWVVVGLGAESA